MALGFSFFAFLLVQVFLFFYVVKFKGVFVVPKRGLRKIFVSFYSFKWYFNLNWVISYNYTRDDLILTFLDEQFLLCFLLGG